MIKLESHQKLLGLDGLTVGDFWAWGFSDLLSNRTRSIFAEFLVGAALSVLDKPRIEWDAVDLRYMEKKIEVKTAAYLQAWKQKAPSIIRFDIAEKLAWDAETSISSTTRLRSADCYVFCLFAEKDMAQANILNVSSWEFYVVSTTQVIQEFAQQKSVGLARIQKLCAPVNYITVKQRIDEVLGLHR
jgi:hypothetical protein